MAWFVVPNKRSKNTKHVLRRTQVRSIKHVELIARSAIIKTTVQHEINYTNFKNSTNLKEGI